MYQITQEIYSQQKIVTTYNSWEQALEAYNKLNQCFVEPNWTRHSSCQEEVSHTDNRFNLFNEGALILKPIK